MESWRARGHTAPHTRPSRETNLGRARQITSRAAVLFWENLQSFERVINWTHLLSWHLIEIRMKTKNRDQSLSDSRELDGSYDQLTGKFGTLFLQKQ